MDTANLGGLTDNVDKLQNIESIAVVGCGSSYNAAIYGAKLLKHSGAFTSVCAMDADSSSESNFRVISNPEKRGMIIASQSGETKEIVELAQMAKRRGLPLIGIV